MHKQIQWIKKAATI